MSNNRKIRSEILRFLEDNGWSRRGSKDGKFIRLQIADRNLNKPVSIYFASSISNDLHLKAEIEEALSTIRQFYGVSFSEIRHRMQALLNLGARSATHPRDFVTTRVPDHYVRDDTIDISVALSTVGYLRRLIEGAAIAETEIEGISRQVSVKSAKNYTQSCRFGHTFRGSFGLQIECPLSEAEQLTFDIFSAIKPLGRKVSERVSRGMLFLNEAFQKDDVDLLVRQSNGLTARMCNDLADYLEDSRLSSIEFGVEYDGSLAPEMSDTSSDYQIRSASIPLLREACKLLEPKPEETPANIVGRVVVLKASGNPLAEDDATKRLVTVHWEGDEGRSNVQVELGPREYAEAIRAHERGLHVQLKGMLLRRGSRYALSNLSSFVVLD